MEGEKKNQKWGGYTTYGAREVKDKNRDSWLSLKKTELREEIQGFKEKKYKAQKMNSELPGLRKETEESKPFQS